MPIKLLTYKNYNGTIEYFDEEKQPHEVSFSVNVSSDLYSRIASYATRNGRSLSSIVEEAIVHVVH